MSKATELLTKLMEFVLDQLDDGANGLQADPAYLDVSRKIAVSLHDVETELGQLEEPTDWELTDDECSIGKMDDVPEEGSVRTDELSDGTSTEPTDDT